MELTTRGFSIRNVLDNIGLGALIGAFEAQRIDSLALCQSLSDDELKSLGLSTIGERFEFREALQNYKEPEIEARSSSSSIRERVSQLFRPTRSGPRGHKSKKGTVHVKTWTGNFFCLSDRKAPRTPSSPEKVALQASGLGPKRIQFKIDELEKVVFDTLSGEQGFPQLKDTGGFELLHCTSSCRDLQLLTCKWDVKNLRQIIGSQAKLYIRPIQKNIDIKKTKENDATSLKSECSKCKKEFVLNELRAHLLHCDYPISTDSDEELPDPQIQNVTSQSEPTIIVFQMPTDIQTEAAAGDIVESAPGAIAITEDIESVVVPQSSEPQSTPIVGIQYIEPQSTVTVSTQQIEQIHVATPEVSTQHFRLVPEKNNIDEIIKHIIKECEDKKIYDPVDILRLMQSSIVTGRRLDIIDSTDILEGDTNFIMINRESLLSSAFEEIEALEDLRPCLEVQFFGESAVDFGGPRKEFFSLALREIAQKYFNPVREWGPHYITIGKIMGLSLLQNGKLPRILPADIVDELFNIDSPKPFIVDLRKGLDALGIFQLAQRLPSIVHLFTPVAPQPVTFKRITNLLEPEFSPDGSNRKRRETTMYQLFVKYLREAASGRRNGIDLGSILTFICGTEEEPVLGFGISPTISFVESSSLLPTANTCINKLNLSVADREEDVPDKDFIFNLFDFAFCNNFFGLK